MRYVLAVPWTPAKALQLARWRKAGLSIDFEGIEGGMDHGRVEISTETYQRLYEHWQKTDSSARKPL